MPLPFVYIITKLAEKWGVPPWEVDMTNPEIREWVRITLRVGHIEAEAEKWRKAHGL